MGTSNWKKLFCVKGHKDPARYKGGACIECSKENSRLRYEANKPKHIAAAIARHKKNPDVRRDEQRAWRLKVPVAEIREAISQCGGKCEACFKPLENRQMCIDHDHKTGQIRGVLCIFCNALEGMLNKQPRRIELVQRYLERVISKKEGKS